MPVAHFHIVRRGVDPAQRRRLLVEASRVYAEVLDSPIERVRVFVVEYDPESAAVGGEVVAEGAPAAPYFTAIVLAGRPATQRQELLARLTDLVVDVLGAERRLVRGRIVEVAPENWAIGGVAAASVRADEIAARAATP
ncbi:tautomerase family protein [Pseudonocardia sp. NPDC049154]|uniref:tautomerase family protein n=1 Tax=Pseudonocardia sp. NPDC049154 TaxID=3155501 RepID=UPI0033E67F03